MSIVSQEHESEITEAVMVAGEISQTLRTPIERGYDAAKRRRMEELIPLYMPTDFAVLARTNYIAARAAETLFAHQLPIRQRVRPQMPQDWQRAKAALRMIQAGTDDAIVRHERLLQNKTMAGLLHRRFALGAEKASTYMAGLERTRASVSRDLQRLCIGWDSIELIERIAEKLTEPTLADIVLAVSQYQEEETETPGIFCGTVHAAKGREWETVFVIGAEQETWPGSKAETNIEEERRLFYVAMTRAKTNLIVSWARQRRAQWGRQDWQERTVSRFVAEAGL